MIYSVYTRDIAHANAAQIAATMHETSRQRHRGVSNPPGRPRDRTSLKVGGLLTPPLHQWHPLSAFGARHRTPRWVFDF